MKTIKALLFLVSVIPALLACKKEKGFVDPWITMGDSKGATVIYHNTGIVGTIGDPGKKYWLDLNEDGVKDLEFFVELVNEGNSSVGPLAYVRTLHDNCQVLTTHMWDSIYTLQSLQYSTTPSGDPAVISWHTYSCRKATSDYQLDTVISRYDIHSLQAGDLVEGTGDFRSGTFDLMTPNSTTMDLTGVNNGVTYYSVESHHKDCPKFPQNVDCYIAVRLLTENGPRLGWVYMKNYGHRIEIHESGIQ